MSTCFATILVLGLGAGVGGDNLNDNEGYYFGKYQITQEVACPAENVRIQFTAEHVSYTDNNEDKGVDMLLLEFKKVFK